MAFFILTRFVLVKYSRAFVERPSQGTSSLALRLTTVSLDTYTYILWLCDMQQSFHSTNPYGFSKFSVFHAVHIEPKNEINVSNFWS